MIKAKLLIEKIKSLIGYQDNQDHHFEIPPMHTECTDCVGGHADIFSYCETCNGKSYRRMTYEEYIQTIPQVEST